METLVAMAVLAIALVVILQLFSSGLRSVKAARDATRGLFYAREKMEEILLEEAPQPGVREGEWDDGFRWRSEVAAVPPAEGEEGLYPFDLYSVTVEVLWEVGEHKKSLSLTTLTPGPLEEGPS